MFNFFLNEGFYSIPLLFSKLFLKLRNITISFLLGTQKINLDWNYEIRGVKYIKIGKNFYSKSGLWIEAIKKYNYIEYSPVIIIGDNNSYSKNVHISASNLIKIGNNVLMGSNILIADNSHGVYGGDGSSDPSTPPRNRPLSTHGPVIIEDNVWLCDGVKVLSGSKIGHGSIISLGSVVRGEIPPNCVAAGNPCRPIKYFIKSEQRWRHV